MMNALQATGIIDKAKAAIFVTLAAAPPPAYLEKMGQRGYTEADARELWAFTLGCANDAPLDYQNVFERIAP